jgi:hypothetical protein
VHWSEACGFRLQDGDCNWFVEGIKEISTIKI